MIFRRKKGIALLLFIIMLSIMLSPAQSLEQQIEEHSSTLIYYDEIINCGLQLNIEENNLEKW